MIFASEKIIQMNESDVRSEIIDIIISKLGYKFGETNYAQRERALVYPYAQIGHRSRKDVPVGAADYVCGIDGQRGCFTVEAKRGNSKLSHIDAIQAYSYAVHPEVCAHFFCLCNGNVFQIFATANGVDHEALVSIENLKLIEHFHEIEALLSPKNILRLAKVSYDTSRPIVSGRSNPLHIQSGWLITRNLRYDVVYSLNDDVAAVANLGLNSSDMNAHLKRLSETRQPIVDGVVTRDGDGRITANVLFDSNDPAVSKNMLAMQIAEFTFVTARAEISLDTDIPTIFESVSERSVPAGTRIYNIVTKQIEQMGVLSHLKMFYRAVSYYADGVIQGTYHADSILEAEQNGIRIIDIAMQSDGDFELRLRGD